MRLFVLIAGLMLAFAGLTGRLAPILVADSASYLEYPFQSLTEALGSTRPPGYPLVLKAIIATFGLAAVPIVQLLVHALASTLFAQEALAWKCQRHVAIVIGLAVAFGCTPVDHVATVATDSLAASLGVLATTWLLRWVRDQRQVAPAIAAALSALFAISLRPAYLSIIPWMTFAAVVLVVWRSESRSWMHTQLAIVRSLVLLTAVVIPLLFWIGLRGVVVGDASLLPFGHQNLAGVSLQLATDEELLDRLGTSNKLLVAILDKKQSYLESGGRWTEGDDFATMTIEGRWDDYVWHVIVPATDSLFPNDAIGSHQALAELNRSILSEFPSRYIRWVILGMRRAIWGSLANFSMQLLFLPMMLLCGILYVLRLFGIGPEPMLNPSPAVQMLFLVASSYFVVMVGFVVLTSPPLGRFADATAIFFPAWFFAAAVEFLWPAPNTKAIRRSRSGKWTRT